MNTIKAVVRNGRIEPEAPLDLPEGTRLVVLPADGEENEVDNNPESIAAWLKWCDSLEPLVFTEEEKAVWEADRRGRKEWEQAHFDECTDNLARICP